MEELDDIKELLKQLAKAQIESQEKSEKRQKEQEKLWAEYREEQSKLWAQHHEVWEEVRGSLKSIGNQLANMSRNWGSSAEELFYRSLKKSLVLGGVQYDKIERNVQAPNKSTEFDILLFNGTASAIVEVKSKGHPKDIREFVERKVKAFHEGYPELKDHKLYFGLASTITNDALVAEAREAGIYLLTQDGSHVEVVNEDVRSY